MYVYVCLSEEGLGDEKKKREGKRGGESGGRNWKGENKVDFQDQGHIYSKMLRFVNVEYSYQKKKKERKQNQFPLLK